jgi:hypothetical protein
VRRNKLDADSGTQSTQVCVYGLEDKIVTGVVSMHLWQITTIVALLVLPPSAFAALVTIQANGTLTSVDAPLADRFSAGTPWSLTYTYDTASLDIDVADRLGAYPQFTHGFSLLVGDYQLHGTAGVLRITNDLYSEDDAYLYASTRQGGAGLGCYYLCADFLGAPIGERQPISVWLSMIDPTGTVFGSDALPNGAPDLNDFPLLPSVDREGNVKFSLEFATEWGVVAYNRAQVVGSVSSITTVPVPSAFSFLISAIGLLQLTRRKAIA